MFSRICSLIPRSATSGDLFFWKPNCYFTKMFLKVKNLTSLLFIICSAIFAKTESTEIGLQLFKSLTGPPLCITATRACFILSGKTPVDNMRLQTCASGILIVSQTAFNGFGLMSSAPEAQSFFNARINSTISHSSVGYRKREF